VKEFDLLADAMSLQARRIVTYAPRRHFSPTITVLHAHCSNFSSCINQSINQSSLIQAAWPIWREDTHVNKKKTLQYTIHYYYYSTTLHYQWITMFTDNYPASN